MHDLTGKVALVTGASKGIGAGIARGLAAAGAAVIINYASDESRAAQLVDEIEAEGGRAIAAQGDVAIRGDAERVVAQGIERFGALHVLINNAAYFTFSPIATITEDDFHKHFDTNVLGTILMTQAALRHLGPGASIINIASASILTPMAEVTLYTATKAALVMITGVWAKELGPRQIRVNAISPGTTETEGNPISTMPAASQALILDKTALGRVGRPSDIAPAAVFLASDAAGWITGEIMQVSGGFC